MIAVQMVSDPGKAGVLLIYATIVLNECWWPFGCTQSRPRFKLKSKLSTGKKPKHLNSLKTGS